MMPQKVAVIYQLHAWSTRISCTKQVSNVPHSYNCNMKEQLTTVTLQICFIMQLLCVYHSHWLLHIDNLLCIGSGRSSND